MTWLKFGGRLVEQKFSTNRPFPSSRPQFPHQKCSSGSIDLRRRFFRANERDWLSFQSAFGFITGSSPFRRTNAFHLRKATPADLLWQMASALSDPCYERKLISITTHVESPWNTGWSESVWKCAIGRPEIKSNAWLRWEEKSGMCRQRTLRAVKRWYSIYIAHFLRIYSNALYNTFWGTFARLLYGTAHNLKSNQ